MLNYSLLRFSCALTNPSDGSTSKARAFASTLPKPTIGAHSHPNPANAASRHAMKSLARIMTTKQVDEEKRRITAR